MNNERLINEFLELLQIDSETKHEGEIAAILQTKLEAMGFHVAVDESAAVTGHGAGNIIATLRGTLSQVAAIYFTVHMDTVTPGVGVRPEIRDGYVFSDGSSIMGAEDKDGIAAFVEQLRNHQVLQIEHGDIQ